VVERNIGLGRIVATDLLSPDGEQWHAATEFPDFDLHQRAHERGLSRRLDERQHERRGSSRQIEGASEVRQGEDRRQQEDPLELARRERSYGVWQGLRTSRHLPRYLTPLLAIGTLLLAAIGWWARPPDATPAQCSAPAGKGAVWDTCDKRDANLREAILDDASLKSSNLQRAQMAGASARRADLSYADLSGASLVGAQLEGAALAGATLRNADLTATDFRRTDLRFADFTGAKLSATLFEGADLSNALWIDGSICAKPSIGACHLQESAAID